MTEQIKSAIEWCEEFEIAHNLKDGEKNNFRYAIRSLKAWEEVLAQLKTRRDYYEKKDYGLFVEVNACISIIESLLKGVTE